MELHENTIKKLPDAPGVYQFYNSENELIYVGKATSLRNRVRSYFAGLKSPRPIELMIHEVAKICHEETGSVIEAIILEGKYIKEHRPKYNVMWRDDKSWNYLCITKDEFPRVVAVREHDLNVVNEAKQSDGQIDCHVGFRPPRNDKYAKIFGPYPGLKTREVMRILRKLFYISTCEPNSGRSCFYRQIGLCLGVCSGEISAKEYKHKVIRPLVAFLNGRKKQMIKDLELDMRLAAKEEKFEEAGRLRNQLSALETIQDIALLNSSFVEHPIVFGENGFRKSLRVEGYDISNLGTSGKVGSMVVFDYAGPVKSQYRKFIIRTVEGQSDVDCLAEVIERRLKHPEWSMPDVFLVDGGLPQVNRTVKILRERGVTTPVIGIAKGPERRKNEFFVVADDKEAILKWVKSQKKLLICVRDEAHRFAIKFQREKRKLR